MKTKRTMKKAILSLLALCSVAGMRAQIRSVEPSAATAKRYERVDFTVRLKATYSNAFLQEEVALDMLIRTPGGEERLLPCYWVEGASGQLSRWEARFTPQQAGEYALRFRLTERGRQTSLSKPVRLAVRQEAAGHGILHTRDYWTLVYDDGTPFRGVAENICWESRANDDSRYFKELHEQHDKYNYDYMLPLFARNGGNFIRVWMCGFNFPIDQQDHFNNHRYTPSDAYYNPSAVARLDHFVGLCEELGVHAMLCMGQGAVRADRAFFTDEEPARRFMNRLRYIVARWGCSPAIGMWEFFNEIDNIQHRNAGGPIPAEEIVAWHARMSKYLKSIDPYGHPVTTSISHRDLEGLNSVPDLDINQKHIYCNTGGIPAEILRYENRFGKPYVIGEFGYEWDWSKNFDEFGEEMDRDFRRGLWYGIFSPTPLTPMSWWWEYFENRGLMPYFRGVRLISDRMLADGKGAFEQLSVTCPPAEAMAVRCGETIYVYLYNNSSEALGRTPLTVNLAARGRYAVQSFDPASLAFAGHGAIGTEGRFVLDGVELAPYGERIYIFTPIR